jgi:predicted RNA-binding Zn-ribbon protein involved in translation (DUF1610 family)
MPDESLDDASVEVSCGSCGKITSVKIAELKKEGSFVCPSCGEEAWVDSAAFRAQLHTNQRATEPNGTTGGA